MRTKLLLLFTLLALWAGVHLANAQTARFFRIAGPTATTITALRPDGTLIWINAQAGATYTIQTCFALPGGTNWVDYSQVSATAGLNLSRLFDLNSPAGMAFIPAGSFTMGDTDDHYVESDAVPITVTVSAFYMDVNLVTDSLWQSVYVWGTNSGFTFGDVTSVTPSSYPVSGLTWYDAVQWCNARSLQAGLTPVYYTDTNLTLVYTNGGGDGPYANWTANGYRLPTEAEWEKAARGGLIGLRFPWGNTITRSQANYNSCTTCGMNYDLGPPGPNPIYAATGVSPVGSFPPNGYGLCDMAGNLEAWCWDFYGGSYAGGTDPRGPDSGTLRVLRGGAWQTDAHVLQCFFRDYYEPYLRVYVYGLRCVRGL